jgi:hypothetical protein
MGRSQDEERFVNRALMSHGLGKLDDPGLIPQLGFLFGRVVKTHEDFRVFIARCEPAKRPSMYEALKPYIRFDLKPLDVYIAETLALAESKQLPTVGPNGELLPFKIPEVTAKPEKTGDLATAQKIIDEALAKQHLTVFCRRCTREQTFHGMRKDDCVEAARQAGWKYVVSGDFPPSEICPDCAETRVTL